jgi:mannose-6-phosphate isomerase-like protein (cupin superfamily)
VQNAVESRSFETPDDSVSYTCGRTDFVHVGGSQVARLTLLPGWRQKEHGDRVGLGLPVASSGNRVFFHVAGRLRVVTAAGEETVSRPGAVTVVPAGSDAWVEGEESVVLVEWTRVPASPSELSGLWLL